MRRILPALAALALLASAGAAQAAQPYVDQANGYRLTPPEGWVLTPETDAGERKLTLDSADGRAQCNVTISAMAITAKLPQSTLDASFRRGDADKVVTNEMDDLGVSYSAVDQTLIDRDGHPGVYAKMAVQKDGVKERLRKLFMASPGRAYNFNCTIFAAEEGAIAPDLDALFASVHLIYP